MDNTPSLPGYTELAEVLEAVPSCPPVSQVHGLLCGFICGAMNQKNKYDWEKLLLESHSKKSFKSILHQLFETSYKQLTEFSFEFNLVLPEDETDINLRAEALGLWCQGFLTGLEQAGITIENQPEGAVAEAISDLIEIANINFGQIATNEEDETAYVELVEYVRLAVLMIFHELRTDTVPPLQSTDPNILLH